MDNLSVETSTTDWRPDELQGPDVGFILNAILRIIFYIIVMLLGLFGNSLILGVYWPKPNKTSTHILIMGLAGMDLTVCMMRVYNIANHIFILANEKTPSAIKFIRDIGLVNMFASSVLTAFIAVDRYDYVCRPKNRWLNRYRAKLMILGSYVGALIFASPRIIQVIWLPASIVLQKIFLTFQCVLYILVLGVICVCYGRVYMTIRRHVKVNVLSRRHTKSDLSATISPSQHDNISTISGKEPFSVPQTNDGGVPSTSRRPESNEMTERQARAAKESLHRNDHSMAATQGNVNFTPTDRTPGNANPNQPKGKRKTVSLQSRTTRMMFGTSVVLLVTWFPYLLYVALGLARLNGIVIPEHVMQAVLNSTLSVFINNILNPLIYGLANRRFRKDCLHAMKKIKMC